MRADVCLQEPGHPCEALLVLDFRERVEHGILRAVVCEVELGGHLSVLGAVENMFLDHRPVEDRLNLPGGQLPERHIGTHAHRPADIHHQRPHERVPRSHRALLDGQGRVGDIGGLIGDAHDARAVAMRARAIAVERERFGSGKLHLGPADRTVQWRHAGDVHRRLLAVPVGAEVAAQAREHQAHMIKQLGRGPEGAAYVGDARTLVQRYRRRHMLHAVHLGVRRRGHAAAGIGRKGLQITARPFGIQHPERERTLARTRNPRYRDLLPEGDFHVYILEVVNPGSTHLYLVYCHRRQR